MSNFCPECGQINLIFLRTYDRGNGRVRVYECKSCGNEIHWFDENREPGGRHTDATNIGMAKQGSKAPKPVSKGILPRISRFIRLGAARNMVQRGNLWPFVLVQKSELLPYNLRHVEINLFGWNINLFFGGFSVRIVDILNDDLGE